MAAFNDNSQRPQLPLSQSFRAQSEQDALANVGSSARTTSNGQSSQTLHQTASATAIATKLEGANVADEDELQNLNEDNLHHRLNASGSVQAIVVDDDVLFAGLQGGEIVVSKKLRS